MKISLISDTHAKHGRIILSRDARNQKFDVDLPGGDLLIHTGDFMTSGYSKSELLDFLAWLDSLTEYKHIVFIAGNHDRLVQIQPDFLEEKFAEYPRLTYLQDSEVVIEHEGQKIKIYGSPWQPEFYNWAFNLPRNGEELKAKWDAIPADASIVLTHGPAQGMLDTSGPPWNKPDLGCELLTTRLKEIKPMIHVCGHIHGGYGYQYDGNTHYFNASILDENYMYTNLPFNFDWNPITNEIFWNIG